MRVSPAICLALALAALLPAGCAYHLGPTNGEVAGARSVQIAPFYNKSPEPGLGDYLMNSLRKAMQRDSTYRLATHAGEGDIVVTGTILTFQRHELSFVAKDVITVQDYELLVSAQIIARERGTGKILIDKPIRASTTLRAGADLTSSERAAMPVLAENLARAAMAVLVDGTW